MPWRCPRCGFQAPLRAAADSRRAGFDERFLDYVQELEQELLNVAASGGPLAGGREQTLERAIGYVMARRSVTSNQALELLQDAARRAGRELHDFATAIIDEADRNLGTPP